jgi:N-methylhydantoinase B
MTTEGTLISAGNYDPVTAEVIQMRLQNIVDEMGTILRHTSGSPVLTEVGDFCTAIFDDKLEHLAISNYVVVHIGSSLVGVRSIQKYYSKDEIRPGDHFILNNPYTAGALHQGDVGIITPLFYQDEVVAWAFSNAHVLDIGGMSPGGWAPTARDVYSEGLSFPPTKIVNQGEINLELFNIIRNNVRLPEPVVNDIKSLIASNNVSQRRLTELLDRIGIDEFRKYCEINKALSERMVRDRIASIPDGEYEAEDWVEYDGHGENLLVRIKCKLIVEGDSLTIDFSGSDPQIDGFVNATDGTMIGIVGSLILLGLAYDIPINYGILRPINIEQGPKGTVVNPVIPAPVSCGHMEGGAKAGRAVWEALTDAMQLSENPAVRDRTSAFSIWSWPGNSWTGFDKQGNFTAFAVMDCGSVGLGAQSTGDGMDISGLEVMLNNTIPDVEINEGLYPMLYLWRSINKDSAGPGYHRGGLGIDLAWVPYGTNELSGTVENSCYEVPPRGVLGGYPGSTNFYKLYRGFDLSAYVSNKHAMPSVEDLNDEIEDIANHASNIRLKQQDIFRQLTGGGGGYGDPLYRPIHKVKEDVDNGFISTTYAEKAYGVKFESNKEIDYQASKKERSRRISERIQKNITLNTEAEPRFGIDVRKDEDGTVVSCANCGHQLAKELSNWRSSLVTKRSNLGRRLEELGVEIKTRDDLVLEERYCPNCGLSIENKILREDVAIK